MILKKFFGKTIDLARKSARQMYGDDIVILESFEAEGKNPAGVTVLVDKKSGQKQPPSGEETRFRNVFYRRSDAAGETHRMETRSAGNPDRYETVAREAAPAGRAKRPETGEAARPVKSGEAGKMDRGPFSSQTGYTAQTEQKGHTGLTAQARQTGQTTQASQTRQTGQTGRSNQPDLSGYMDPPAPVSNNLKALRRFARMEKMESNNGPHHRSDNNRSQDGSTGQGTTKRRFQPSTAPGVTQREHPAGRTGAETQREILALHKRFDKLEALLDSGLIASNLDLASHPAFQQLVETGIRPTEVGRWFRQILDQGIDPDQDPQAFLSQLSGIIRNALTFREPGSLPRFLLFAGPSGSGKTRLIMKLALHPEFLAGKNLALVSVMPGEKEQQPYYTVLKPFCDDHKLAWYPVSDSRDVTQMLPEWQQCDHVLIDTPSLTVEKEDSFRQYWNIRQLLAQVTPLEVHYVVNAARNRFYFRNSGNRHHPLQPDFVAITHMDEVSQWGPMIPFMEEMGCGARFISNGPAVPGGLTRFDPAWFARHVLHDS